MCMTIGCNSQFKFCYTFRSLNLISFYQKVSCERNSSHNFTWIFFETFQLFLSRSEDAHVIGCNMYFLQ